MLLSDLVTNKTINLFETLDIQTICLTTDPKTWEKNEEFLNGKKKV